MKKSMMMISICAMGCLGGAHAMAAQPLQITGKVIRANPESIVIRNELDQKEVEIKKDADLRTPEVGERVRITAQIEANEIKVIPSQNRQEPGQAQPTPGNLILDDRAFYDA